PADNPVAGGALLVDPSGLDGIGVIHVHARMAHAEQADLAAHALGLVQSLGGVGDLGGRHGHAVVTSSMTPLRSVPMPSASTSTTSPGLSQTGGSSRAPAPVGVPVMMVSPGTSVVKVEM